MLYRHEKVSKEVSGELCGSRPAVKAQTASVHHDCKGRCNVVQEGVKWRQPHRFCIGGK